MSWSVPVSPFPLAINTRQASTTKSASTSSGVREFRNALMVPHGDVTAETEGKNGYAQQQAADADRPGEVGETPESRLHTVFLDADDAKDHEAQRHRADETHAPELRGLHGIVHYSSPSSSFLYPQLGQLSPCISEPQVGQVSPPSPPADPSGLVPPGSPPIMAFASSFSAGVLSPGIPWFSPPGCIRALAWAWAAS